MPSIFSIQEFEDNNGKAFSRHQVLKNWLLFLHSYTKGCYKNANALSDCLDINGIFQHNSAGLNTVAVKSRND